MAAHAPSLPSSPAPEVEHDLTEEQYHEALRRHGLEELAEADGQGRCVKLPCGVILRCFGCSNRDKLEYFVEVAAAHMPPLGSPQSCWGCFEDTRQAIETVNAYRDGETEEGLC